VNLAQFTTDVGKEDRCGISPGRSAPQGRSWDLRNEPLIGLGVTDAPDFVIERIAVCVSVVET
jgi:hypothetical protein